MYTMRIHTIKMEFDVLSVVTSIQKSHVFWNNTKKQVLLARRQQHKQHNSTKINCTQLFVY